VIVCPRVQGRLLLVAMTSPNFWSVGWRPPALSMPGSAPGESYEYKKCVGKLKADSCIALVILVAVDGADSLKLEWSFCTITYNLQMINFVILLI